jgi:type III secretory pathway component EscV
MNGPPRQTANMKVFLSHSSIDKDLARRLARDLQSANVHVWLDQWEIGVGEEFVQRIEQGLDEVDFVIVLLTRASVSSEWVDREWRQKVQQEAETKRIAVVPVRGEPCEIPDFLAQRSYADISGGSYPLGVRYLLTILRHYSNELSIKVPEDTFERGGTLRTKIPVVTPIALEVGRDLIPIVEPNADGVSRFLDELVPALRNALRGEFGFSFPGIRVLGNDTDMPARCALILIDEVPELMLQVGPDDVLVNETVEALARLKIKGEPADDPGTGQSCSWIAAAYRDIAKGEGLATWDTGEYLCLALQGVIRRLTPLFLDIDTTRNLVASVEHSASDLVATTVPKTVSWFELTEVLRRLIDEGIGIGDMERILQALPHCERDRADTSRLAERVRHALKAQITAKFAGNQGSLRVFVLDPEIEILFSGAIQRTAVGPYLVMDPKLTRDILAAIRDRVISFGPRAAGVPILVAAAEVRPFIRKLVSLEFPMLHVLSQQDLEPDTRIQPLARIRLGPSSHHTTRTGQGTSV